MSVDVEDDNGESGTACFDSETACFELSTSRNLLFHIIVDLEELVDWAANLDGAGGMLVSSASFGTADADLLECMEGLKDAGEASLASLEGFECDTGIGPMNIIGAVIGDGGGGGANLTGTSNEVCEPLGLSLFCFRR